MMKKTLILGLIVCSLLIVPMASVVGADQELSVEDGANDVMDMDGNFVTRKNIDIAELSCIKEGKRVELQLKLVDGGIIQNSEFIAYEISLITSENEYAAAYGYGECIVYDMEYNEISEADYSGVGTRTLSISFNLSSSDEECQLLQAVTYEVTMVGDGNYYMDMAPDLDLLTVDAGTSYEGYVGESIEFSGSVEGGSPPYNWSWDFGDGNTSDEQNPTHVYNKDGTYEATLIVSDVNDVFGFGLANVTIYPAEDGSGGNGSSSNDTDKSDSSDSGLLLFVAVIAIISIIGVAVIVYIIRR
jgi:hypothetical protein